VSGRPAPAVSVVLAVRNDADFLPAAIASVLRQTVRDLELIVVDDASTDATPAVLAAATDDRLVLLRNEEQLGLAASLNRGLERAGGRYVARLDADDVAFPERLARQLARLAAAPAAAIVGTAVIDLGADGAAGPVHRLPSGARAVRWHALFSSPFFHPTVLVARDLLERHGLRYDPRFEESEDFDLWTRVLRLADGDNLADALVAKRVHAGQASLRRGELQASFQREIALREIQAFAPGLGAEGAELAWGLGAGRSGGADAASAFLALLQTFEAEQGRDPEVRTAAARVLARTGHVREAARLAPGLPLRVGVERMRRRRDARSARRTAGQLAAAPAEPVARPRRVTVVSPEPTPYRAPLFDRIAGRPEVELTVIYAARTVAQRGWSVEHAHRSVFLRGVALPGARRIFRHDYPLTPGVRRALRASAPDVVVVSGWSTFASQAAIVWSRAAGIPYVLLVESHELGPRARWRRGVKGVVVPRLVRGAAGVLTVGALAAAGVVARGADPARVRTFANTIDVAAWEERAERLRRRRRKLRAELAVGDGELLVLSVGRLAPEKSIDTLLRAVAQLRERRAAVVVAGSGRQAAHLMRLADELGVRLLLTGELSEERLAGAYVAADVFALVSTHEPWGVVVNEAAASGLPLVLSNRVGAAYDLLRDGDNGVVVPAGDVDATAAALRRLAADDGFRAAAGARSRELVRAWDYEPSVESFVAAVRDATAR